MRIIILVLLLAAGALQSCFHEEEQRVKALMSEYCPGNRPGASLAVIKNGKVLLKQSYGLSDIQSGKAVSSSTSFNICSLTKQFTARGILMLEKEGKLSLDDRIEKYFPALNKRVAEQVTIRHLLTHSSGIIDHYAYADRELSHTFTDNDVLKAIEPVDSLYFSPGSSYRYSNTAYCLLSLIIEKISGMSYPAFIRENIFQPLRMDSSDVIHAGFGIAYRAYGYDIRNDSVILNDAGQSLFFSTMGDGGIYTTVDDYLKWIFSVQSGLDDAASPAALSVSAQYPADSKRDLFYGFGWFVAGKGAGKTVYHTGSNGGFRTMIFMIPSEKYAVIIFSNRSNIDPEELVHMINKIYRVDDSSMVRLDSLIS